jgi:glycosyltransferase involved in cell wall biosynthesis
MKFSIITPTYKRPDELKRCIESVLIQNHKNWEMIVVNDFPEIPLEQTPSTLSGHLPKGKETEHEKNIQKIKFFENEKNMGNNFSKNFAFSKISNDSDYLIFLDDDDWLSPNALHDLNVFLEKYKNENNKQLEWLVTERVLEKNFAEKNMAGNLAKPNFQPRCLSYFYDYLLFRKIKGDKTHIISTDILHTSAKFPRFSTKVKNGEEWFFFCQIPHNFTYIPLPTTLTSGYTEDGLNNDMQKKYTENTWKLFREIKNTRIFIYLILRSVNILLKKIKVCGKIF